MGGGEKAGKYTVMGRDTDGAALMEAGVGVGWGGGMGRGGEGGAAPDPQGGLSLRRQACRPFLANLWSLRTKKPPMAGNLKRTEN